MSAPARLWLLAAALAAAPPAHAQKFYPDDPLHVDRDDLDIPEPGEIELSGGWDMIENTFGFGVPPVEPVERAVNINTLGEVPDSSWFTNRIGERELSLEELRRGPDTRDGPDMSGPWVVLRGKSEGITPGFSPIRDPRGDLYFVKFDPPDHPNLASAADVIGTKFFHAIGYHVPENYIAYVRREQLELSPDATISGEGRKDVPMTQADMDAIFAKVRERPDGTIRVLASRALEGEPLGPRKHFGTRPDDPNDVFPHQDRREVRGYRVFCAWLNHDDSRSLNTMDVYVSEGGRSFVRHYLIDFASILGSGSVRPQDPRAGHEYLLDWGPMAKAALTLGIWDRPWRDIEYPDLPEVGNFESDFFEPERWKPEHPNLAFKKMRNADAFWAARIVSRFSDEAIRAIVETGQYDDPASTRYVTETLIERRDKVVDHYFRQLNPLSEFAVDATGGGAPRLVFENLGEKAGLGEALGYGFQWFSFDNAAGERTPLPGSGEARHPELAIPGAEAEFLMIRITTRAALPAWGKGVEVYLRNDRTPPSLVGIERDD